jgi:hypothetical protein
MLGIAINVADLAIAQMNSNTAAAGAHVAGRGFNLVGLPGLVRNRIMEWRCFQEIKKRDWFFCHVINPWILLRHVQFE